MRIDKCVGLDIDRKYVWYVNTKQLYVDTLKDVAPNMNVGSVALYWIMDIQCIALRLMNPIHLIESVLKCCSRC